MDSEEINSVAICDGSYQYIDWTKHVRAFPTFEPISKSTYPSKFYYNYSLPASKLGFISNFSHFPSLQVVESVTSSSSKLVGFAFKLEH